MDGDNEPAVNDETSGNDKSPSNPAKSSATGSRGRKREASESSWKKMSERS